MTEPALQTAHLDQLSSAVLLDLLQLRVDVFVVEQECPYPEIDERDADPSTLHLWTVDDSGRASAYLRVAEESDGSARIGRVCTRADQRGRGLATRLMTHALQETDGRRVVLHAQSQLRGWYERFGFAVVGAEFLEDGIPHLPMARSAG